MAKGTPKQQKARKNFKAKVERAQKKYNAPGNKKSWRTCMKEA